MHTSPPLSAPSVVLATDMADDGGVSGIATASLAMSVLALLFGMLAVVILAIFIYFHIRLTNEVRRLRESGELSSSYTPHPHTHTHHTHKHTNTHAHHTPHASRRRWWTGKG